MHSSARQLVPKGPDGLVNDLSLSMPQPQQQPQGQQPEQDQSLENSPPPPPPPRAAAAAGPEEPPSAISAASPPLMHFPHCRLEITSLSLPRDDGASESAGKVEQIALPGALVRTLLSRFEEGHAHPAQLPRRQQTDDEPAALPTAHGSGEKTRRRSRPRREQQLTIQRHFDDADDWVFSRCLLADFTGFREDEAEILSAQGRLCCWASVVLRPRGDLEEDASEEAAEGAWELGFVVQRVGVRDPGSGWCECF